LFNILLFFFLLASHDVQAQDRLYRNEFPLQNVTLLDGHFKCACDLNIQTLLKYDVDRLLAPLRKEGDVVRVLLPVQNSIEHLPNVPSYITIMHGTIVLDAKTGTEDLKELIAEDGRWGHIALGQKLPDGKVPIIIEDDISKITGELVPVKDRPLTFATLGLKMLNPINVVLEPFYRIHDARYMMYWMVLTNTQSHSYLNSLAVLEKKLELQKRTIDFVIFT
jgi:uncharacterized protein